MDHSKSFKITAGRRLLATASMVALFGGMGTAQALDIDTGNPDAKMTWGNTVRYNVGWRVNNRDDVIGNTANNDEGDYAFNRGDKVTNRWDLLTELDFSYKALTGFRLSAAAWKDQAIKDQARTNPIYAARGSYLGNQYSGYTKRYAQGPSGEILDAYVFTSFNLGDMPASVKIGRQATLWGEALQLTAHSVSYAQTPSDGYKGLANPGIDAKEAALPIGQISGTLQVAPNVSLAAQYFFEWKPTRLPQGGTYLGGTDFILQGPDRFSLAPGLFLANKGVVKAKNSGEWGVNARWQPEFLGGGDTLGFYYREFSERTPTISLNLAGGSYSAVYPEKAKLYGISLSKNIGGLSVGTELVHREKTALNSSITDGAAEGARGDTTHLLMNAVYLGGSTAWWDLASITAEVAYSRWDKVTTGEKYFTACFRRPANDQGEETGCVTKDAWQGTFSFGPQWVSVRPGWDLAAGVSYSVGLKGNGAVLGGGNVKAGSYGLKLTATYNTKHDFTIAYNDYLATYQPTAAGTIRVSNGSQIQDRGWLALTYKGSF